MKRKHYNWSKGLQYKAQRQQTEIGDFENGKTRKKH